MRSSTGAHFIALDHVRAVAALLVVVWHFSQGAGVPFAFVPSIPPVSILSEGHTGVGVFMTLSGYLFAKLLEGRDISFPSFLWNRAIRLLPLLIVMLIAVGAMRIHAGSNPFAYVKLLAKGIVLPTLPNGGWSITVEFQFYLILPVLLWMFRRSTLLPLLVILFAIGFRAVIFWKIGQVQTVAYWTIIGRIDQFVLGMLLYHWRMSVAHRHILVGSVFAIFVIYYWCFDRSGGFYANPDFPKPSSLAYWIVMPTMEGACYATIIAWYDTSFKVTNRGFSWFLGKAGEMSYSIYLLHFFIVFRASSFVDRYVMEIHNFYVALPWAVLFYVCVMLPIGVLSYKFVEEPFLRLRVKYIRSPSPA